MYTTTGALPSTGQITVNYGGGVVALGAYANVNAWLTASPAAINTSSLGAILLTPSSPDTDVNFAAPGYNSLSLGAARCSDLQWVHRTGHGRLLPRRRRRNAHSCEFRHWPECPDDQWAGDGRAGGLAQLHRQHDHFAQRRAGPGRQHLDDGGHAHHQRRHAARRNGEQLYGLPDPVGIGLGQSGRPGEPLQDHRRIGEPDRRE